ncbi:sulfur carrier protein ThiS [bacterium]|nr:sulfur carrier protein ThiS [bacterium]
MKVLINNKITDLKPNTTLNDVVKSLMFQQEKGFAVAVNEEVIAKTEWETRLLKENDQVLLFGAIQGG